MRSNFYPLALSVILFSVEYASAVAVWGQCGGQYYTGSTVCDPGSTCVYSNPQYSQCLPNAQVTSTTATTTTTKPSTSASSTISSPSTTSAPPPSGSGVKLGGLNIAGFDFGCGTDGTCSVTGAYPPLASLYGPDGLGQMQHFVNDDKFNTFRLPVGWQFLVNGVLGGPLDATNLAKYDTLVQGCLATGAYCIIDIHNYARWNGGIIGQGGPTNAQFTNLWSQLATKYASQSKVIFGIMNEPHDVPDINLWATTVQAAVTAIRSAGATSQYILLPGNNWTSAATFVSNGSAAALVKVTNPDGSTTNLIFDVHKYLDSDNSGTHPDCVTDNISSAFAPLATWLRTNKRMAMNTETGGGNVQSCVTYLSSQLAYLNANSDVYLGFTTWAAGSFDTSYVLGETPTKSGTTWTDTLLVAQAIKPNFHP